MHLWILLKLIVLLILSACHEIVLFLQAVFEAAVQKPGLLHPTKNVGFAMTKLLARESRKCLQRWLIIGVIRLENENNRYKIKINEEMRKTEVKIKNEAEY